MKPLIQYEIKTDIPQRDMALIAKRFFTKDNRWHFFHEGNEGCIVRISKRSKPFENYLYSHKFKFQLGIWSDPHQAVRKYQTRFEPIFHEFTMLGLFKEDVEFFHLFNRVTHCFANMCGLDGFSECMYLADRMVQQMMLYSQYGAQSMIQDAVDKRIIPAIAAIEKSAEATKAEVEKSIKAKQKK